jgi:hypothetical protein
MDPVTLLIIAAFSLAAGAATAVTWSMIQNWLNANRIPGGTATIVKERLQSGNYRIVTGVFDTRGTLKTQKTWQASSIDNELNEAFEEGGGTIVVQF